DFRKVAVGACRITPAFLHYHEISLLSFNSPLRLPNVVVRLFPPLLPATAPVPIVMPPTKNDAASGSPRGSLAGPPPDRDGSMGPSEVEQVEETTERVLRPLPCSRCLRRMVSWDPKGNKPVPACVDTKTASNKCSVCAAMRALRLRNAFRDIRAAVGAGSSLAAAFEEGIEEYKAAQLAGKKALQKKAEMTKDPIKRKAEDEQEEWLGRQRKLVALEEAVTASKKQASAAAQLVKATEDQTAAIRAQTAAQQCAAGALTALNQTFREFLESFNIVNQAALDDPYSRDPSPVLDQDNEDED
ncbi:hypothetical protein CMUS01_15999, partial [Colletotrichum musicola]